MSILLYISLGLLLLLIVLTTNLHRLPNWLIYAEVGAFLVYQFLNLLYHPLVGICTIMGAVFVGIMLFLDRDSDDKPPAWWHFMLYTTLFIVSAGFLYQVVEIFTGRLF